MLRRHVEIPVWRVSLSIVDEVRHVVSRAGTINSEGLSWPTSVSSCTSTCYIHQAFLSKCLRTFSLILPFLMRTGDLPSGRRVNCSASVQAAAGGLKYDHLLLAIMDNNPYFSDGSKQVTQLPSASLDLAHVSPKHPPIPLGSEQRRSEGCKHNSYVCKMCWMCA
jgi:hypothetical protein